MKTFIQKLGKSLMGPLSIIVAAGLLLGLASTLQNPNVFGNVLQDVSFVNNFVSLVNALAGALFGLLPILFCMSVAQGMSREDREVATFASIIGFALFHTTIRFFLSLKGITADTVSIDYLMGQGYSLLEATQQNAAYDTVIGIFTYRMSIFGGIIVGLWTAMIHNRFHETQLPVAFSFFSGKRFVPIMMVVTIPFLGLLMFFVWPVFNVIHQWIWQSSCFCGSIWYVHLRIPGTSSDPDWPASYPESADPLYSDRRNCRDRWTAGIWCAEYFQYSADAAESGYGCYASGNTLPDTGNASVHGIWSSGSMLRHV